MYYSIVAYTMNIITPCRHQLCAWFVIMVYIMCYVYCDHFDDYVEQLL